MVEQILNGLFFDFLLYMLMGVVLALLRSPQFYELVLLVATPVGTYRYKNDFQASLIGGSACALVERLYPQGQQRSAENTKARSSKTP